MNLDHTTSFFSTSSTMFTVYGQLILSIEQDAIVSTKFMWESAFERFHVNRHKFITVEVLVHPPQIGLLNVNGRWCLLQVAPISPYK